jgi:hypothetical protein
VAAVRLQFVDTMVEAVVHKCKAFVEPLVSVNIAVTEALDILQLLAYIVDKPMVVVFVGTVDKVVAHILYLVWLWRLWWCINLGVNLWSNSYGFCL